jgi:hypothetical protein
MVQWVDKFVQKEYELREDPNNKADCVNIRAL